MIEVFFRRAGWAVQGSGAMSLAEAVDAVRDEWFDVVGLSQSCNGLIDDLASHITTLRRSSRNKALMVMVGGPAFIAHPERAAQVGADATASDGNEAVRLATRGTGKGQTR